MAYRQWPQGSGSILYTDIVTKTNSNTTKLWGTLITNSNGCMLCITIIVVPMLSTGAIASKQDVPPVKLYVISSK